MMTQAKQLPSKPHTCPRCHMGAMSARATSYAAVYRGTFFSLPHVPAWQCDICAYIEYDDSVMARMEALVGETLLPHESAEADPKLPPFESDGDSGDKKSRTRMKQ